MNNSIRLTVDLPLDTMKELQKIAQSSGTTITESLARSIRVDSEIKEKVSNGAKLLLLPQSGQMTQIIFSDKS